jgi:hypothetical protein
MNNLTMALLFAVLLSLALRLLYYVFDWTWY